MLKEFFILIVSRSFDHDDFNFDNYPTDVEILEVLKRQEEGSIARVEKRYKIINKSE